MKVTPPARPVFLAVFLGLTALAPAGAQQQTAAGKKEPAASPKPAAQSAKPASPAVPGAKSSPAPEARTPKPSPPSPHHPITPSPSPAAVVTTPKGDTINVTVAAPAPPEPKSNNWAAGVVGLALLTGLGFFGLRYARQRGLTVPDALQKMGVEMPQDGAAQGARPLRPVAPQQPPLPSLADLPSAGPAIMTATSAPPITAAPAYRGEPRLVGLEGAVAGVTLDLTEPFSIGRDAENALALTQDATVSRRHASVEPENGGWMVRDNGSSNGTYVNGVRLTGAQPLRPGDEIKIGSSRLRFEG